MNLSRGDTLESPENSSFAIISPKTGFDQFYRSTLTLSNILVDRKPKDFPTLKKDFVGFCKNILAYICANRDNDLVFETISTLDWISKSALFAYCIIHRCQGANEFKLLETLYNDPETDFTFVPDLKNVPGTLSQEVYIFNIDSNS